VAYGPDGSIVSLRSIDRRTVLEVVEGLQSRPVGLFVFVHDALYLVSATEHPDEAKRQDWLEICGRYDKAVVDARSEPTRSDVLRRIESGELEIVKVTAACDTDDVPEVEAQLRTLAGTGSSPAFHVTRAISFILELVPTGISCVCATIDWPDSCSKEAAIATLCKTMGISPAQVLAFGDGSNDRGMLAEVGHGVAMGNAVDETRQAARHQTLSNDEGGVGAFLERVFGLPSGA